MTFKKLGPYATLLFASGAAGVFLPSLVSLVIAFAAIFVSGVVVVAAEHVVLELRGPETTTQSNANS